MMILALVFTSFVIYAVGRVLLRVLGWPTSLDAAGRWCQALLVLALLFSALPEVLRRAAARVGPLPAVSLGEVIPGLCILGLVILGYVAWHRRLDVHEGDREQARAALQPRRRALPLPPREDAGGEDGFRSRRAPDRFVGPGAD
ncbi:MAG: hypothetical protein Q8S73_27005 [Deltaproteobacteria bacterium]|nr:hypothetical protein [Myxococcales bacterium]MDP3217787.1 hypothetical protein [Deltaproteobacteria bacterium]